MAFTKKALPKKSDNISQWYNQLVLEAGLADYGPAKGTMIFRPYGFGIWENVQKAMDVEIKAKGVENAYFPMFIPESLLRKEKEHVAGFSPELAVVTIGGGEELEEKLIVRPTSETIMYDAYSMWVHSWRDLPVLINQWNNVVRWEKRTYLFLRTTEFLWQEGHTAHATHAEAYEMVLWAINMYENIYKEFFGMAGYVGIKSKAEKFAGALTTLTFESLMPDGKALQSCTSHDLGQNFSVPFEIKFQDKNGKTEHVWQTSWGLSTRSIGGLIMAHGDDNGLILPPRLAPIQAVIVPVDTQGTVVEYANKIADVLKGAGVRVRVDARDYETFGFRINDWELKGVPIRIEAGGREAAAQTATLVRRDNGVKEVVSLAKLAAKVQTTLDDMQHGLYSQNKAFLESNTSEAETYAEFKNIMEARKGFIRAFWCEKEDCEKKIKEETKASTRCLPLDAKEESGNCVYCGSPAKHKWLFAQAY